MWISVFNYFHKCLHCNFITFMTVDYNKLMSHTKCFLNPSTLSQSFFITIIFLHLFLFIWVNINAFIHSNFLILTLELKVMEKSIISHFSLVTYWKMFYEKPLRSSDIQFNFIALDSWKVSNADMTLLWNECMNGMLILLNFLFLNDFFFIMKCKTNFPYFYF